MGKSETGSLQLDITAAFFRCLTDREFVPTSIKDKTQLTIGDLSQHAVVFLRSPNDNAPYWFAIQNSLALRRGGYGSTGEVITQNIQILQKFAVAWLGCLGLTKDQVLLRSHPAGLDISSAEDPSSGWRLYAFQYKNNPNFCGLANPFTSAPKSARG